MSLRTWRRWKVSKTSLLCLPTPYSWRAPLISGVPSTPSNSLYPPLSGLCTEEWAASGDKWGRRGSGTSIPAPTSLVSHLALVRTPGARPKSLEESEARPRCPGLPVSKAPAPHLPGWEAAAGKVSTPKEAVSLAAGKSRCGRRCAGGARWRVVRPYLAISAPPGKPRPGQPCPRLPPALSHRRGGGRK